MSYVLDKLIELEAALDKLTPEELVKLFCTPKPDTRVPDPWLGGW